MRCLTIICFLLLAISCKTSIYKTTLKQNPELHSFLKGFETAVLSHDIVQVFNYLDQDYREEQLQFLGNKEQLINKLFCGNSTTSSKFECTKLGDINSIKLVDVQ